ncbi:hypothetical protein IGL98_002862 [Enterococcus sp. DIV0840]|uniref:helix-turn-helix domain-containing protein n=1 Tax=unclassified Enterococcus TaxID=2608891 RepID=UPI001A8FE212|nr:MerR family transcriptional regulator [Enterococcus sp. DIV0849a]MBO0433863.1 MerR family transcriptional regulator [Enterococcus sp. DIV0849a]
MGQLAELMAISKHQIRYNEEKGLLSPAFIDNNGYHKYGTDQVYQLANILLLRSLGVSTAQIDQFMQNQDDVWAEKTLKETLKTTEEKIQQLISAKKKIETLLLEIEQKEEAYFSIPKRSLSKIYSYSPTETLDTVAFFKAMKNSQISCSLFSESLYYFFDEEQIEVYTEDLHSSEKLLPAGDYLVKRVWVTQEHELIEAIDRFRKEMEQPFLKASEIIVKEAAYSSVLMNNQILYELQYLISLEG